MSVCRLLAASGRMATLASRGTAPLRPLATSAPALADAPTHTGQQWEENDLRSVRFAVTGATKEVNPQWAIDLIAEVPVKMVPTRVVSCDGGGSASTGHPRVFINLDHGRAESCSYCGLRFQLDH